MKKTALVLALGAAFAGTAMAQSSVTLYGRLNTSYERDEKQEAAPGWAMRNNLSRLGVRGVEDLGGGLSTLFGIETQLNSDNGQGGLGNDLRTAYVGFGTKSAGSLVFGRLDTAAPNESGAPLYYLWSNNFNAINNDGGTLGWGNVTNTSSRVSNGAGYGASFGGLNIRARYALVQTCTTAGTIFALGQTTTNGSTDCPAAAAKGASSDPNTPASATKEADTRTLQLVTYYKVKGLQAGVGYENRQYSGLSTAGNLNNTPATTTTTNTNLLQHRLQFNASYDFGFMKFGVHAARDYFRAPFGNGDVNENTSRGIVNEWTASLGIVPAKSHTIYLNYGQRGVQTTNSAAGTATSNFNNGNGSQNTGLGLAKQAQLGYSYDFSARTRVYAAYQYLDTNNIVTTALSPAVNASATVDSTRTKTLVLGMRHNF